MGDLIIISGPSGVGKGTIIKKVYQEMKENGDKIHLSRSYTTRAPRKGEIDGIDYHFISEREFIDAIKKNEFLEYNLYANGKYYGTNRKKLLEYLVNDIDVILEIDVNGYLNILTNIDIAFPGINIKSIFIMPPSRDELEARLRRRDDNEDEESIKRRLIASENEIKFSWKYNNIVVNDNLDEAVNEVLSIIKPQKKLTKI